MGANKFRSVSGQRAQRFRRIARFRRVRCLKIRDGFIHYLNVSSNKVSAKMNFAQKCDVNLDMTSSI